MDDPSIMTLEEWRRAKEVFDAAWELEPARWKAIWPPPVKAKKLMEISFEFAQVSIIIAQRGRLAMCQLPSS
jgi:hypothetical protein